MERVHPLVERAAGGDISVLILGETGVGKEVLARAIHAALAARQGPFVALNCAALSESLLESELFGHERAPSPAPAQAKPGCSSRAGGTVFLDEIGELPPAIQVKLLRVLETRRCCASAASSRAHDRRALRRRDQPRPRGRGRRAARFRQRSLLPAQRHHADDPAAARAPRGTLPLLARGVPRRRGARRAPRAGLSPAALAALQAYRWPGNVRELRNAIERAAGAVRGRRDPARAPAAPVPRRAARAMPPRRWHRAHRTPTSVRASSPRSRPAPATRPARPVSSGCRARRWWRASIATAPRDREGRARDERRRGRRRERRVDPGDRAGRGRAGGPAPRPCRAPPMPRATSSIARLVAAAWAASLPDAICGSAGRSPSRCSALRTPRLRPASSAR